ncbi:MAG: hypothetical protein QXH10_09455 [Ignisphaera sp.]
MKKDNILEANVMILDESMREKNKSKISDSRIEGRVKIGERAEVVRECY